jgi:hypothetical protein
MTRRRKRKRDGFKVNLSKVAGLRIHSRTSRIRHI